MTLMHYRSAIHTIDQLTVHNITILSNPYKIVDDSCYTFILLFVAGWEQKISQPSRRNQATVLLPKTGCEC